jgi:hypothetical protein
MPAKWERFYLLALNLLLVVVAALLFLNVMTTSGWRTRSAYLFLIAWGIALRIGGRWIPFRVATSVEGWRARGRLHEFFFNVLWVGLPLGIFGYLARWRSRWELVGLILLMSLIPLFFMRSPDHQDPAQICSNPWVNER